MSPQHRVHGDCSAMVYQRGSSTFGMSIEDAYPSTAFDDAGLAPIHLIEVASDGSANRAELTKELMSEYVERDYGVCFYSKFSKDLIAK
jgi:hypothetical protein